MRSRVSKGVPLSLIFYIEWMSLTFICFDCWCKMWGFAPNSFRGQKWNTGARNGHIVRTRNGQHHEPEMDTKKLFRQFCNFARGRYHLVNENIWSSTPRERTIIYYSTLHCYRFVNALRIRDENEREVNPTPKIAFPFPPIHKPSAYWCAPQRVISIQNEQKIALKIQRCSLPCSGMLFTDSNSLS